MSFGGGKEIRTPDPLRARQVLSQLSYTPKIVWWLELESNQRHEDFQSSALPTELSSHIT